MEQDSDSRRARSRSRNARSNHGGVTPPPNTVPPPAEPPSHVPLSAERVAEVRRLCESTAEEDWNLLVDLARTLRAIERPDPEAEPDLAPL